MPIVPVQTVDGNGMAGGRPTMAAIFYITPNAFAALRAPIVDGREFDGRDGRDGPPTIVINETMARLCCAGASVVGQRLRVETDEHDRTREIVGVVADVPTRLDQATPSPVIYVPYLQQPQYYRGPAVGMFASMTFVMRPSADAGSVLTAARGAAAAITPDRPVDAGLTVQAHLNARLAERRNYVLAVDAFALLATLLAVLGLHGLMTHAVVARADEIAVRKALGAGWPAIATLVARPPLPIVAAGITLGLAGGLAASTLLAPQLWGVAARDLSTFTGVTIALGCAAGAGGFAAVRRALGIDPIERLRCD